MSELDKPIADTPRVSVSLSISVDSSSAPEPTTRHRCRLIVVIMVLCISVYFYGHILTNLSTFSTKTIQAVYGDVAAQTSVWGVIIGMSLTGGILGAALTPCINVCFTRSLSFSLSIIALATEGIVQITNPWVLLVCRILQGVVAGAFMSIIPVYIHELSPHDMSGLLGVFTQLSLTFATLVNFLLGVILTKVNASPEVFVRIMQSYSGILLVIQILLILVGFVPQSPHSLIKKNKEEEAKQIIEMFVQSVHVDAVFKDKYIEVSVQNESDSSSQADNSGLQIDVDGLQIVYPNKAYFLGFQLLFMFQVTGIYGILTQANNIVLKVLPGLAEYTGLVICAAQFLATLVTLCILISFGRRTLILFGNLNLGILDIMLGIFSIFENSWSSSVVFALLVIYFVIFGLSLGPAIWIYVPEILPPKAIPFATMMKWIGATASSIIFGVVLEVNNGNAYPAFFGFGGVTLIFFIVNIVLMVETKGLSPTQIIAKLKGKSE